MAPGTANPIPIPSSGTNYGFWVSERLSADVTPAGSLTNIRWFTDGSNNLGTGITAKGNDASTGADSGYREATGTVGTTGTQLTQANHSGLNNAPVDIFGFTSASPRILAGSITNPSTGDFGALIIWQAEVASTAAAGTSPAEQVTFREDET